MIQYISTRNSEHKVRSAKAILDGQAPDGGLYIPDDLDAIRLDYHDVINGPSGSYDFRHMARVVWNVFFPDYGKDAIDELVDKSYLNKFSKDEITPISKVGDYYVLELYHGPTAAFKDVALSALPNLLTKARELCNFSDETLILTATSGDTGSAALCGFSDVPGTRIIVFYPEGGVSETQKLQMVTAAGANACATAVRGNFDDAQTGVKALFRSIPKPCDGVSLSSANSINIGRLVPQIVYYFAAYRQLLDMGAIRDGDRLDFTVPTGNFGDIMAGYFAMKMGLPINKLICASNSNDVLTEFLQTGHYDRRRTFFKTTSPSMDILVSSNLERLLYYICGEENTRRYMRELSEKGEYQISPEELSLIREVFCGIASTDDEGSKSIGATYDEYHYLMDTHTAIAWACADKSEDKSGCPNVILSTASPYKFCRAVLSALGEEPDASDEVNMNKCHELTGAEIPAGLAGIFGREIKHKDVIDCDEMKNYVVAKSENRV